MPKEKSITKTTPNMSKSLDAIIANIEKSMGFDANEHVIVVAPSNYVGGKVPSISFGYQDVDEASGCGGVPKGKLIEIFGPESGGKSFLTLKLIGSAQKDKMNCCLVDAENSYDPPWARQHGVDVDSGTLRIVSKQLSAEHTLDLVCKMCESGGFGLVVVDSTAALVPQKELDGSVSDQDYALLARAMSKGCKKIMQACGTTGTTCVFINQIRTKMGVTWGSNEETPGGKALKFYSHQRIRVNPGSKIKIKEGDKEVVIARQSYVDFVKNKSAKPFGNCIIEIVFDAAATNPVVKLCRLAKDLKIIGLRQGTFRISKGLFEGEKTNIDTGCATLVDLADYLVKKQIIGVVLEAVMGVSAEQEIEVEEDIQELGVLAPEDIKSPLEGKTAEVEKIEQDESVE